MPEQTPQPAGPPVAEESVEVAKLPAEAVVVRYGLMLPHDLEVSIYTEFDHSGKYGLSVVAGPDLTAEELVAARPMRHPVYRTSTVGALGEVGYELQPEVLDEPDELRWLVVLPGEPTDEDWDKLPGAFSEPIPKPA